MSKNFFFAVSTIVGTVIGAGLFSVPFVISKSGILGLLIYLPVLAVIQYFLHKMFAEVILSTEEEHRIPGYVGFYAGRKYKKVVSLFCIAGAYGSLLAYVILGGRFLYQILGPYLGGDPVIYSVVLFAVESFIVLFGIKAIAEAELFMTGFLLFVVVFLSIKSLNVVSLDNFKFVDWKFMLLPYGPIFFSVGGQAAIPEVCRLLKNEKKKIKKAIMIGTAIPPIVTLLFVFTVVGATGIHTTPDTVEGLKSVLGNGIIIFVSIFGLLGITTSFLTTTQAVREIYWWDFKMNKTLAWALACVVPLILFFLGAQDLRKVVGITGAVSGGIIGMIMVFLNMAVKDKAQKKSIIKVRVTKLLAFFLSALFIFGLSSELFGIFFK